MITDFRGEVAALSAALFWAIASFIYVRLGKQLSSLWLNLVKSSLAIGLIGLTFLLRQDSIPLLAGENFGLLWLSGAIGIGFGDSVFFESLIALEHRYSIP